MPDPRVPRAAGRGAAWTDERSVRGGKAAPMSARRRARIAQRAGTILLALLVVAGCGPGSHAKSAGGGSSGGQQAAPSTRSALHWRACSPGGRVRCGRIQVPLSYRDPSGRKITLALTEVPATAPASQRLGILLVNPGGPGASGNGLAS